MVSLRLVRVAMHGRPGIFGPHHDFAELTDADWPIMLIEDGDFKLVRPGKADNLIVGYRRTERHLKRSVGFGRAIRGCDTDAETFGKACDVRALRESVSLA